jgi:hypothetical protein
MAPASSNNSVEFLTMHTYLKRNYNYHINLSKVLTSYCAMSYGCCTSSEATFHDGKP